LLDGRELDHAPAVFGVAEGREDLSGDAKVGVSMRACSEVSGKESASRRNSLEVISKVRSVAGAIRGTERAGEKGLDGKLAILYILYIQK
jgi:hypothetical protein